MAERWRDIVSDQDLVAAAIMAWEGPLSILGLEAMGFTGTYIILACNRLSKAMGKELFSESLEGRCACRGRILLASLCVDGTDQVNLQKRSLPVKSRSSPCKNCGASLEKAATPL
jgi:hypothetical protein